ncbi:hypothetical protein CEUSTIGMA_g3713.t1 [Chlamydomonas eustigma]|uniref:Uncharacterized protein n=1 Tax=Chlamydomonas eustigma TaxID=1157962 RepID=A0A250WZZ7_9CHLO|nr:hypothetical protein CEUSTIGMA_g3713.t1 [Chlamydomonas eustigma]|eukprot:GAX76269.1 hypothetical protein CEUSTIGMA_g3713.t1 [Chlamydomonas eustigma]
MENMVVTGSRGGGTAGSGSEDAGSRGGGTGSGGGGTSSGEGRMAILSHLKAVLLLQQLTPLPLSMEPLQPPWLMKTSWHIQEHLRVVLQPSPSSWHIQEHLRVLLPPPTFMAHPGAPAGRPAAPTISVATNVSTRGTADSSSQQTDTTAGFRLLATASDTHLAAAVYTSHFTAGPTG